jgi:hypothetical protein
LRALIRVATLQKCIVCGHLIASNAPRCVGCGTLGPQAREVEPKRATKTVWKVLLGLLLLAAIMTKLIPDNKQSSVAPTPTPDEEAVATLSAKGWCFMFPDPSGWPPKYDTDAPLSKWKKNCDYDTEAECLADKKSSVDNMLQASAQSADDDTKRNWILSAQAYDLATECVASEDPRLKKK